jgi:hypothetical protein
VRQKLASDHTDFFRYCWSFYGPNEIYGEFFGHTLTARKLWRAVRKQAALSTFCGDSFDREAVRNILLQDQPKDMA